MDGSTASQQQLGLGLVGGRLYQAEAQGEASARIAIRVLRGEPASSLPPQVIPALSPRYNWRELRRWNISENRLPPGSVILFAPAAALAGIPLAFRERGRTHRDAGGTHRHAARSAPTPPKWLAVVQRSRETATRASTATALKHLVAMAEIARLKHNADVEIRIVSIPGDWSPPAPGVFVKETMNDLADLGERMAADPESWGDPLAGDYQA